MIKISYGCVNINYDDERLLVTIGGDIITNKCYRKYTQKELDEWMAYGDCDYEKYCNYSNCSSGPCTARTVGCFEEHVLAYYDDLSNVKNRVIAVATEHKLSDDVTDYIIKIIDMIINAPAAPTMMVKAKVPDDCCEDLPFN